MSQQPIFSVRLVPGFRQVKIALVQSVWIPKKGQVSQELEGVWTPWEGSTEALRRLALKALQLSSDSLPDLLPLENDTPKASAPPGGPRGVLSVPTATLKNVRRRR